VKLHEALQSLLDQALRAPAWTGWTLLALALLVTVPGRHGQRPLNAALLGGGAFALAWLGLRGVGHAWLPGVTAVIAAALAALFGFVALGWSTALVAVLALAAFAFYAAPAIGMPRWLAVPPFAVLGFVAGLFEHQRLSLVLPPLFASLFATVGATILWAPHRRGAGLWQLNDVDWALGLWGVLFSALLALSLERQYRKKLLQKLRPKPTDDAALKKQIEAKQAAYQRAFEQLQEPPEDEPKH
jgi:hypothetical protein